MKQGKKKAKEDVKTAVVIAWRKGETDLEATIESATKAAGANTKIITVEDGVYAGPGRTRDRGIMAAGDAEVIIVADAHMRFQGKVLRDLSRSIQKRGGLAVPFCHHNEECSFVSTPYAGARIVYKAQDGREKHALSAKWSKQTEVGKRGAVMGACYAFRRDWYMGMGRPLAALQGWGCDEEILSICSWISGFDPVLFDGHVAHRYRQRPPWPVLDSDHQGHHASRMALINAVVMDPAESADLKAWQRSWVPEGIRDVVTPEIEAVRQAIMKCKRTWSQWRKEICEPEEINGVQQSRREELSTKAPLISNGSANYGCTENKRVCQHCGSANSKVMRTVQTGRMIVRYRTCEDCSTRRATQEILPIPRQNAAEPARV